jgi:hypothetical protein
VESGDWLICSPECASKSRIAHSGGLQEYTISFSIARNYSVAVLDPFMTTTIASATFIVVPSACYVYLSEITGPLAMTAGVNTTFRFTPYDNYTNVAVFEPKSDIETEFLTYFQEEVGESLFEGDKYPAKRTLRGDKAGFDISVMTERAGMWYPTVERGYTHQMMFKILRFGPVLVSPTTFSPTRSLLRVRPGHLSFPTQRYMVLSAIFAGKGIQHMSCPVHSVLLAC